MNGIFNSMYRIILCSEREWQALRSPRFLVLKHASGTFFCIVHSMFRGSTGMVVLLEWSLTRIEECVWNGI